MNDTSAIWYIVGFIMGGILTNVTWVILSDRATRQRMFEASLPWMGVRK
jgi:hypothetical protein